MNLIFEAMGIARTGGGRATMLPYTMAFARAFPEVRLQVWVEQRVEAWQGIPNLRERVLPVTNRFLARVFLQALLPIATRRKHISLTHFLKNLTVEGVRGKTVATLFDLHPLVHPEVYPRSDVFFWRHVQPGALRRVDGVISISQHTADDLVRHYRLDPGRVRVIHPGIDADFRPRSQEEIAPVLHALGINGRYILHVGAISPKKNLSTLIRAFAKVRAAGYEGELILVGPVYEKLKAIPVMAIAAELGVGSQVRLLGEVPDRDLKCLMAGADLFAFASLYEGFGLVVAEAMASGTPVVASRAGAVAEVIGDVSPTIDDFTDADAFAQQMGRLIGDPTYRASVVAAGLNRVRLFSWESVVQASMDFYRELLG